MTSTSDHTDDISLAAEAFSVSDCGASHPKSHCCEHWPTVTICGSMRFYHQMLKVAEELTLDGFFVLMPFVRKAAFMEADIDHPGNVIEKLDRQHKRKIDLATSIVVVSDETGYYGESTRSEIEYAGVRGKAITYRRISLKHTCAGHPSDACTACRARKMSQKISGERESPLRRAGSGSPA